MTSDKEPWRTVGMFWLVISAVVLSLAALVAGTMALMMIWVSAQAAGFVWCGFMGLGVVVFFSWLIREDGI